MLAVNELKAAIAKRGLTEYEVAVAIGISPKTFWSRKKRGIFRTNEIEIMIDLLKIDDPMPIFFLRHKQLIKIQK